MAAKTLFEEVVRITYVYLGPAADRFVSRQISNHLHKKPDQLAASDMTELIDWVRLAMSFLTEDQLLVDEYVQRLEALDRQHNTRRSSNKRKPKELLTADAETN